MKKNMKGISFFEKYLTVWVGLCIITGVLIGEFFPVVPNFLGKFEYANVSIPIAILIWMMIFPMMLKIDFGSILHNAKQPKGLTVTIITNWLIKPFSMYLMAYLFFKIFFKPFITDELATQYLAGAVLLGAAPCTAMVFVWSYLTKGNPAFTLVQVAINVLIILIAFTPIIAILLGISNIQIPYSTLFLSVVLFVVIPFAAGFITRKRIIKEKGLKYFEIEFLPKFSNITITGLFLTLIIIFSFQGEIILNKPFHIFLIAIPLTLQTIFIFLIAYLWSKFWNLPHDIAAPAGLIGASNFFELAVAVAISLFGINSGATLATVVGVLVEVPVMLFLVKVANSTKKFFNDEILDTKI